MRLDYSPWRFLVKEYVHLKGWHYFVLAAVLFVVFYFAQSGKKGFGDDMRALIEEAEEARKLHSWPHHRGHPHYILPLEVRHAIKIETNGRSRTLRAEEYCVKIWDNGVDLWVYRTTDGSSENAVRWENYRKFVRGKSELEWPYFFYFKAKSNNAFPEVSFHECEWRPDYFYDGTPRKGPSKHVLRGYGEQFGVDYVSVPSRTMSLPICRTLRRFSEVHLTHSKHHRWKWYKDGTLSKEYEPGKGWSKEKRIHPNEKGSA